MVSKCLTWKYKNTFALFGIIMFSMMVVSTISDMYHLVKLWGLKNGIKRLFYGH